MLYKTVLYCTLNCLSYTKQQMDLEIQRVAREMYKAFSGLNEEFEDVRNCGWNIILDPCCCAGQGPGCDR